MAHHHDRSPIAGGICKTPDTLPSLTAALGNGEATVGGRHGFLATMVRHAFRLIDVRRSIEIYAHMCTTTKAGRCESVMVFTPRYTLYKYLENIIQKSISIYH
jgi:hypothetical protein